MEVRIVYGPPGTGKTSTLLTLLEKEVETVDINKIAYVSYTKEGAQQGLYRAAEKLQLQIEDLPYFRTLHSMAFRTLGLKRADVISKDDYKFFSDAIGYKFTGYYTEDFHHNDDKYLFLEILQRNNPNMVKHYLYDIDMQIWRFIAHNYKRFKHKFNIVDYTDMIEQFVKRNEPIPVDVAFIDEAQDLTTLQWKMVLVAFRNCKRLYIAGDDDQAIYEWSGADVQYFLRLDGYSQVLHRSYRLPRNILLLSKKITEQISERIEKPYQGTHDAGGIYRIKSMRELPLNDGSSWMILSRNRCFLKPIIDYFREEGYIYTYKRKDSVRKIYIEAIYSYERARNKPNKREMLQSEYEAFLKRKDYTKAWYEVFNWSIEEITYYRNLFARIGRGGTHNDFISYIWIDTIHSVKGGEADNVVLLTDITKQVLRNLQENPDSEHRVFYVGTTRAKHNLYIMDPQERYEYPLINLL